MNLYISSSCIKKKNLYENIKYLSDNHIDNIELSAPHDYLNTNEILNILNKFKGKSFITHNYFPPQLNEFVMNFATSNKLIADQSIKLVSETLLISKQINSKIYGFHPGYLYDAVHEGGKFTFSNKGLTYDQAEKNSIYNIHRLTSMKSKVTLLLENLFPEIDKETSLFCNYEQIDSMLTKLREYNIGVLLDLGHLYISSKIYKFDVFVFLEIFMNKYSHKLKQIHLSHNDGFKDSHLALPHDSWQYEAIKFIHDKYVNNSIEKNELIVSLESRNSPFEKTLENYERVVNALY